ncbi:MAG: hypothetical protein VR64_00405 [Desulfatitalea sp. BRH_c12]|nr:MAG: hypothetical protein VR64_00405 [Desulfatitalea sp. BRH_c12]
MIEVDHIGMSEMIALISTDFGGIRSIVSKALLAKNMHRKRIDISDVFTLILRQKTVFENLPVRKGG